MKRGRDGEGKGPRDQPRPFPSQTDTVPEKDPFHRPRDGAVELPYLEQGVRIEADILRDHAGFAVMMPWETPLMEAHADFVCRGGESSSCRPAAVLNVGFGMGIVDTAIQRQEPHTHIIVEAHPQVVERAREWAKNRTNVQVIHSKWQDAAGVLLRLAPDGFDGIFWDTYEETVEDFFPLLPSLLRRRDNGHGGGRFSFCNVYQPHDPIRHVAYSLYLAARLQLLGISCQFKALDCNVTGQDYAMCEANPYWLHDVYLVPHCRWCIGDRSAGTSEGEMLHAESGVMGSIAQGIGDGDCETPKVGSNDRGQHGARKEKYDAGSQARTEMGGVTPRADADGSPRDFLLWSAQRWKVSAALEGSNGVHQVCREPSDVGITKHVTKLRDVWEAARSILDC